MILFLATCIVIIVKEDRIIHLFFDAYVLHSIGVRDITAFCVLLFWSLL